SALPESRLVARMVERLRPLLLLKHEKKSWLPGSAATLRPCVDVALPHECTKEMQRDGVNPKSTYPGVGDKSAWLSDMLKSVPTSVWRELWSVTPDEQ